MMMISEMSYFTAVFVCDAIANREAYREIRCRYIAVVYGYSITCIAGKIEKKGYGTLTPLRIC